MSKTAPEEEWQQALDLVLHAGQEKAARIPAPEVEKRSAVGAGDSLTAGLVYGLAGGAELEKTLRFAVAAGSAAAMTPGSSLLRREVFKALLKEVSLSPIRGCGTEASGGRL